MTVAERTAEYRRICEQYKGMGYEPLYGKGGVWLRGIGFRSLRLARKEIVAGRLLLLGDERAA